MAQGEGSGGFFQQRLIRYLIRHGITGAMVGWALLLAIIWTDVAGLGSLVRGSDAGALALTMLAGAFAITFGSAAMGIAANRLGHSREAQEEARESAARR
jgi:uncharacterized membrane protein YbhN (UPF0104 family)